MEAISRLDQIIVNLKGLKIRGQMLLETEGREHTERITEMQRERMAEGRNVEGEIQRYDWSRITRRTDGDQYTIKYARFKEKRGGRTDIIDKFLDGGFYFSISTRSVQRGIEISSGDEEGKLKGLKNFYAERSNPPHLFGLSDEQGVEIGRRVSAGLSPKVVEEILK